MDPRYCSKAVLYIQLDIDPQETVKCLTAVIVYKNAEFMHFYFNEVLWAQELSLTSMVVITKGYNE